MQRLQDAIHALAEADRCVPADNALLRLRNLEARALIAKFAGDIDTAAQIYARLKTTLLRLKNVMGACIIAIHLAEIEHERGRTPSAVELVLETLPQLRGTSDSSLLLNALTNGSAYMVALDRLADAAAMLREADDVSSDADRAGPLSIALETAALAAALGGDLGRAAMIAGHTDAALTRMGVVREYTERKTWTRLGALLSAGLPAAQRAVAANAGATLLPREAIDLARQMPLAVSRPD